MLEVGNWHVRRKFSNNLSIWHWTVGIITKINSGI